ncbi:MAG: hypothetical protein KFB93_02950 [Simkaniaceae bacterium]|jgi:hypothetical protein|nr:MAG: hypothetical protein KFB93_02950 [Simkaniaceae bacterium]
MSTNAQQMVTELPPTASQTLGPASGGSRAEYMPGLSYIVGPAMMSLLRMWAQISNLYQELVTTVTGTSMSGALNIANFDIQLGKDQKAESYATGISGIVAGVPTAAMGAHGMLSSDAELTSIGEEEKGATSYKSMIDEEVNKGPNAGVDEREKLGQDKKDEIDHQVNKLKDKSAFKGQEPSEEEREAVKNSTYKRKVKLQDEYRKKLESIASRKQARMSEISNRNNMRVQVSSALGQVSTGGGNIAAGNDRLEQQEQNAKVAVVDAALKGVLESTGSHFRSQVDKMLEEALQSVSALNAISNANKANG